MNTYIYIHVCCINNWRQIFGNLLYHIKSSDLYEKITKIRVNILGEGFDICDDKIEIIGVSNNLSLYESSTLNLLYDHALKEDFRVLYLHTKGVTRGENMFIKDWVKYLCYFNIYKHQDCLSMLDTHDAVGVNLNSNPTHFSGNFWWSTSKHIKQLGPCINKNYNSPEFWVTCVKGNYKELWKSGVNHYNQPYPEELYLASSSFLSRSTTNGI